MSQEPEPPDSPKDGPPRPAPRSEPEPEADAVASDPPASSPRPAAERASAPPPSAAAPKNPRRALAALLLALLGFALAVTLMAAERPLPGGLPFAFAGCFASALGWLWLATPARDEPSDASVSGRALLPSLLLLTGALGAHLGSIVLAVAGTLPFPRASAALLVTGSFVGLTIAAYRVWARFGYFGSSPEPLHRHHGFWLLLLASVIYLPMLGSFPLLDPWETHYGEVAREMLARNDWISLWWAQDGWFFTKPILNFWMQGLSFRFFGVGVMPDQMLSGARLGYFPGPEWACRIPVFWMTVVATYALYKASARLVGRRAAFLGGVVLTTSPYWLLLARQTMADMPYVAPLVVALALLLLAFHTDPDVTVREVNIVFGRRTLRFDGFHLFFLAVLLCVLPQVAYLFSRNVTLHLGDPFGFRPHLDEFWQGSGGGNCGLPGNKRCEAVEPVHSWGQPVLGGVLWLLLCVGLLFWNWRERRTQRLLFLGAWLATAVSVMAKGAPGLVLPLVVALGYPVVLGRFRDLGRMKLPSLLVLLACVALPWYVQMYMRHGHPFFERLVMHDMVNRAFAHVHDTNKGDDVSFRYYVWQLGYGLFPWTGLVAGGLMHWARNIRYADSSRQRFATFMLIWFLAGFGMFSLTLTKFHHYVLPLVPPTAMLAGVLLSGYLPRRPFATPGRALSYFAVLLLGAQLLVVGVACFFPAWKTLLTAGHAANPPSPWLGATLCALGLGAFLLAMRLAPPVDEPLPPRPRDWALSAIALAATVAVLLVARDFTASGEKELAGELRLLHLITYNYDRPWPEQLDLTAPLWGFAAASLLSMSLLASRRLRRHAAALMATTAVLWGIWCCNDYLRRLAPHWAQRDNILAYYEHRERPQDILVAYQMNWKGENFYTGNRMATFVSSGAKFKRWVKQQRKKGIDTLFFTTEHSRMKTLKKELGPVRSFEQLTTEEENNKFFMAKVVFPPFVADAADDEKAPEDEED